MRPNSVVAKNELPRHCERRIIVRNIPKASLLLWPIKTVRNSETGNPVIDYGFWSAVSMKGMASGLVETQSTTVRGWVKSLEGFTRATCMEVKWWIDVVFVLQSLTWDAFLCTRTYILVVGSTNWKWARFQSVVNVTLYIKLWIFNFLFGGGPVAPPPCIRPWS